MKGKKLELTVGGERFTVEVVKGEHIGWVCKIIRNANKKRALCGTLSQPYYAEGKLILLSEHALTHIPPPVIIEDDKDWED